MSIVTTPSVSAIIASYNSAEYLPDAIDSLLSQSLPPKEIVVNDGSTDNTRGIVSRHYNSTILYMYHENLGEAVARNRAIEIASGDYIAAQDADDIYSRDRIERQVTALRHDPGGIACFAGHWVFDDRGQITSCS